MERILKTLIKSLENKPFEKGLFIVVVSEPILEELADVLNRPKIREKYDMTPKVIEEILYLIEERSDHKTAIGNCNEARIGNVSKGHGKEKDERRSRHMKRAS